MAVTVTYGDRFSDGSRTGIPFTLTFDSSYVTGGEEISAVNFGLDRFESIDIEDSEGYTYDADIATGGATANIKAYLVGQGADVDYVLPQDDDTAATNGTLMYLFGKDGKMEEYYFCSENENGATSTLETSEGLTTFVVYKPISDATLTLTDSDTAETDGVELYVRPIGDGKKAKFFFVSPTNAMGSFTMSDGGDTVYVYDSDEAAEEGSSQVYFDEDGTANSRLLTVSAINQDLYVETSSGRWIKIKDDDTAATNGVGVFFDENGANSYERLLFISPTDTDGSDTVSSSTNWSVVKDEVIVSFYFDEDDTAGARFQHAASSTVDLFVPFVDLTDPNKSPRLLTVAYDATAASNGVSVYFDDDATDAADGMLFVSPTDADGSDTLNNAVSFYGNLGTLDEVGSGTDLSSVSIDGVAYGR